MKSFSLYIFILLVFIIFSPSFLLIENGVESIYVDFSTGPDTTVIGNRALNSGGKIMTDQDALVVTVPASSKLVGISMYYSSVSTINSDSSRLFVKSERSWSCAPLGNAHPFQFDQFTLGVTENIEVHTGWNDYYFDEPLEVLVDTIYIWPDLIQQIQPRVVYAQGNNLSMANLNGTLCASPGPDISSLDFTAELVFVSYAPCPPFLLVTDSDSTCYSADTIIARTIIDPQDSVIFFSKDQVVMDTSFNVDSGAQLLIDMSGCD